MSSIHPIGEIDRFETNKHVEIERKFLLKFMPNIKKCQFIEQGYLMFDGKKHLRVRIIDNKIAYLTFKDVHTSTIRSEFEYKIPLNDARILFNGTNIKLTKKRYKTKFKGDAVDIDVYENGLSVVEIEFLNELLFIPKYCGEEITGIERYSNIYIAKNNAL